MVGLEAGATKQEITPPVGYALSGYSERTQGSIGVHDPLYAKALVLRSGEVTIGVISCDIISLPNESIAEARGLIEKEAQIAGSNVMMHGTHTHTGPNNRDTGEEWRIILGRKIAGTFLEAWRRLRPAKLGLADGECFIGVNRRNPSSPVNPHYLYSWPDGPLASLVKILRVDGIEGDTICTIVNYGCHGVTLGPHELMISRDFSGYAVDLVERAKPGSICMFLNAPCGNVNPRWSWEVAPPRAAVPRFNWAGAEPRWSELNTQDRFKETERLGHIMGGEVIKVMEQIIDFYDVKELASKTRRISLPVRKDLPEWYRKRHNKNDMDAVERDYELQVLKVGDVAILGLPGEVFLELGMEIGRMSPFKHTLIAELCNQESDGYILIPQAYEEGGYEPTASILRAEAGVKLVSEGVGLLKETHG
jgi:neutral ceramidase